MNTKDEHWKADARAWIASSLKKLGIGLLGEPEVIHEKPWSSVWCLPTSTGRVFFKACTDVSLCNEPKLTSVLSEVWSEYIPELLAAEPDARWMLTLGGGKTLRAHLADAPHDVLRQWEQVLPVYAEIQYASSSYRDLLLSNTCPLLGPDLLPERFAALLENSDALRVGQSDGLTHAQHHTLRGLQPLFERLCAQLVDTKIPVALHHDDLHDGNICLEPDLMFFDWGECAMTHPFLILMLVSHGVTQALDIALDAPEQVRLWDIYLEVWSEYGSKEELGDAVRAALCVGTLFRGLTWATLIDAMDEAHAQRYRGAVARWAMLFVERVNLLNVRV